MNAIVVAIQPRKLVRLLGGEELQGGVGLFKGAWKELLGDPAPQLQRLADGHNNGLEDSHMRRTLLAPFNQVRCSTDGHGGGVAIGFDSIGAAGTAGGEDVGIEAVDAAPRLMAAPACLISISFMSLPKR